MSERENRTTPLLITFQADIENLIIDGKDLLYTTFALFRHDNGKEAMIHLYGKEIERYWDAAMERDPRDSVAYCDLAIQDLGCIKHHLRNSTLIAGRYKTLFESAFAVKLPIASADVIDVSTPEPLPSLDPGISLDGFKRYDVSS